MSKLSKITRILWKIVRFLVLFIVVFLGILYFAFQTEGFQTWAAKIATNYLTSELGSRVEIGKLKITFIKNVTLQDVFVADKHKDTLVYGKSITVDVSGFSIKKHTLRLDKAELNNVKVKLLKYKNEQDWNFQFLADYFDSGQKNKNDTTPSPWKIKYGALKLNNVDFTYHLLRDTSKVLSNMNYNNIHVSNVFATVTDIDFKADTIYAQVNNLKAKEQCGIVIQNLTTRAKISSVELRCDSINLKTDNSLVQGKLVFKYDQWLDYQDFINKVYIKGDLKDSTYVSFKDIAYFAEELNGFNELLYLKGKVSGFVYDLNGSNMNVRYRNNTQFIGGMSITGLPDIDKSYIHFDAEWISTSKNDLEKFPIPPFNNPTYLSLPNEVALLGVISYRGKFDGFINNFATYGTFKTDVGSLKTDIQLDNTKKSHLPEYSGSISTTNFNLSKLFPNVKFVGPLSFSTKITGKGFSKKELDASFDGIVHSVTYNNYQYENVKIDGSFKKQIFTGNVISKDSNANFNFNGTINFNNKVPKMDFISTVYNFDLQKTNFNTKQLNGKISSQIYIKLNGDNIDNLSGQINFDNAIYKTDSNTYDISTFNLDLDQENPIKNIRINSSILNAKLNGKFKLSSLPNAFTQYLNTYFPTFVKTKTRYIYNDKADIKVKVKKFKIIKDLFLKDLMVSDNTILTGSFDAAISYLYLKLNSEKIDFSGISFKENILNVNSLPNGIDINYNAKAINLTDSFAFKNPELKIVTNDKKSRFDVNWNNLEKPNNSGIIGGDVVFTNSSADILLDKAKFTITDSLWQLAKPNLISIDSSYALTIGSNTFYNQNQSIKFEGKLSSNSNDKFNAFVQHFNLSQINPFLKDANITFDGLLTGDVNVFGGFGKVLLTSKINFDELKMNKKLIGSGEIITEYNPDKEFMSINGYSAFGKDFDGNLLKNLQFNGFYYPKKKDENIDLSFKVEPLDISLLQPFLQDILTFKVGYVKGDGRITGTLDKPKINANLKLFKCVIVVDFLNVQYSLVGDVIITPKQISFERIEIRDKNNNVGSVEGNIFHNNFKDMRIDFDINTSKLMVLNTTAANNTSYYGTAFASGNAGIFGFLDNIKMEINMKTNGGTYFYIPLDGPSDISNNDFIRFVTKDTLQKIVKINSTAISIDFNLEATRDAEVQIIFDEKSGDIIKARGDGILNLKIDSKGKFDMFGDYVLSTGDYLFTLENFVTKKFEIQKGSSIKWNGNVYNANIDIVAIYKQRASIRPLFPNDSTSNYNKRFPVDCKLLMKNKLTSPDISFGIDLPTIDEATRSTIKSLLSDENELNRQVFSLLLLRSFVTPLAIAGGGGITAGGAAAATGSELLSNKMSTWLNGVTKEIEIGVNYRPGGALSNDELDLALSKQLFNDRLVIDGNLGVANTNNSRSTSGNNNVSNLIDVTVEYKLTESGRYRVKGFNRSNDNTQITTNGGPFTQGVGIFYREEFENLNELYKFYLSKFKRKKVPL